MPSFNLRTRLLLGFAVPLALTLGLAVVAVQSTRSIGTEFTGVAETTLPTVLVLEELKFAGIALIASTNEFTLNELLDVDEETEELEEDDISEAVEQIETRLVQYRELLPNPTAEQTENLSAIEEIASEIVGQSAAIVGMVESGEAIEDIAEAREAFEDIEQDFRVLIDDALAAERSLLETQQADVTATVTGAVGSTGVMAVLAVLVALGMGWLTYRSLARPVAALRGASERMAGGDLTARVQMDRQDELGTLGRAFDTMADSLEERQAQLEHLNEQLAEQLQAAETARAAAVQANEAKSAFLASMSHELRTPLNSIINFSKFISKGMMGEVNDRQRDSLTKVVNSATHLLALINDVLDMSKIESGSLNLFIEDDVNVLEPLDAALDLAQGLLADKPVTLVRDLPGDLPLLVGDRQRIYQILLNVMSNASKFTEQGEITVSAAADAEQVTVTVADSGPGIPPEEAETVFELFKQTEAGLRHGSGTGLGMPISRRLAEAHDGALWFESAVGVGTTFYLRLPLRSEKLLAQMPPAPQATPERSLSS